MMKSREVLSRRSFHNANNGKETKGVETREFQIDRGASVQMNLDRQEVLN